MPFKSEKQRKWMHANEPEMAKKWEKEESIRGKLRNLIKQEIKSIKKEDHIKFSEEEMAQLHKDGKIEKNGHTIEFGESINERKLSSRQKKAILIAIEMSGNMTGAADKIEKIKKGLSRHKKVKDALRLANESINEANFRQGDKFELGKDLDYGDEKLYAGDYEVVRSKGPHQYQLKDTHSGKQFTLHKKDFEKYAKKKQFKQINEAGMFDDYYELNRAYMDDFIKNYKKLNRKNVVKKKGGDIYGFRKGEREAHWKYDDDYKLHYDIDKVKALGLINNFNRAKRDHPWS